jgi:hypothetical protein
MDRVGFEPTTSALLGASLSKGAAARKYHLIVQIPPAPFFFACNAVFCTVRRSNEKASQFSKKKQGR